MKNQFKGMGKESVYFHIICLALKKGGGFAVQAMKVQVGVEV